MGPTDSTCLRYRAVTAPIGSNKPHDTAFSVACITRKVVRTLWLLLSCCVLEERTSNVIRDERSFGVVGWMVGE